MAEDYLRAKFRYLSYTIIPPIIFQFISQRFAALAAQGHPLSGGLAAPVCGTILAFITYQLFSYFGYYDGLLPG